MSHKKGSPPHRGKKCGRVSDWAPLSLSFSHVRRWVIVDALFLHSLTLTTHSCFELARKKYYTNIFPRWGGDPFLCDIVRKKHLCKLLITEVKKLLRCYSINKKQNQVTQTNFFFLGHVCSLPWCLLSVSEIRRFWIKKSKQRLVFRMRWNLFV